jgi:galactokinase
MIKHDLADSDYNTRRESCERAAAEIAKFAKNVKTLRDVDSKLLEEFRGKLHIVDYRRARHIVEENERVLSAVSCLDKGDILSLGKLLFDSHESSRINFENSCPELDYLIEIAHSLPGCIGARLSGGGFGGISIHLVKDDEAGKYARRMQAAYLLKTGIKTDTLLCRAGGGAECAEKK